MVRGVLLRGDFGGLRLALDGAGDGFLGGAIVEVLDLLVVLGFPVNEHADGDIEIVGLVGGDYAFGDGISHGLGDGVLCRAEHLHRLARILDGDLVVKDRRGFAEKVRRNHRKQGGEAVLVVGQRIAERRLDGAAARTEKQIDMGDFVAVTDKRLADTNSTDLGHEPPPRWANTNEISRALAEIPQVAPLSAAPFKERGGVNISRGRNRGQVDYCRAALDSGLNLPDRGARRTASPRSDRLTCRG